MEHFMHDDNSHELEIFNFVSSLLVERVGVDQYYSKNRSTVAGGNITEPS